MLSPSTRYRAPPAATSEAAAPRKPLRDAFFDPREIWASFDAFANKQSGAHRGTERAAGGPKLASLLQRPRPFLKLVFGAIERGEYALQPAVPRTIFADKPRTVHQFTFTDQLVLDHLARLLSERSEAWLSDCVFSFRRGRGHHAALARVGEHLSASPPPRWVARRDVSKYGESLQHEHVMADFARFDPGPELTRLMHEACTFPIDVEGEVIRNRRGLPTGANLQLVFENLYLDPLDQALHRARGLYLRFGDDTLFVGDDADAAHEAASTMESIVEARGVQFAAHKSIDVCVVPPHAAALRAHEPGHACGFEYLGMQIGFDGKVTLPRRKTRIVRAVLRERVRQAASLGRSTEERLHLMAAAVRELSRRDGLVTNTPLPSYLGAVTDASQLRELDRWIALLVLSTAYGGGHRKGLFKRCSFATLRREYGLPSLLHRWRSHGL